MSGERVPLELELADAHEHREDVVVEGRGHALEVAFPDGPRGPERERPGAIEGRIRDDLADRPLENADQIARRLEVEEDVAREEPAARCQRAW